MYKKLLIILFIGAGINLAAKNVEFANIYLNQASPEMVSLVDSVAQEIGYTGHYELVEPNKIGLQTNPWYGMICSGVNPQTQNNQIVINPTWFQGLAIDEQKFLIGHYLMKMEHTGGWLTLVKIVPFLWMVLLFAGLFLFWIVMNKTVLVGRPRWQRMLLLYIVAIGINLTIATKIQTKLIQFFAHKYEAHINQLTLAKLPNKAAAVQALQAMDAAVKAGIADGHNLFKPAENTFANLAHDLEK